MWRGGWAREVPGGGHPRVPDLERPLQSAGEGPTGPLGHSRLGGFLEGAVSCLRETMERSWSPMAEAPHPRQAEDPKSPEPEHFT